eukprot:scaffold102277_cov26-Tisochrysis_lutea.AAC.1
MLAVSGKCWMSKSEHGLQSFVMCAFMIIMLWAAVRYVLCSMCAEASRKALAIALLDARGSSLNFSSRVWYFTAIVHGMPALRKSATSLYISRNWLAQSAVTSTSHGPEALLERKSGSRSTPSSLLRCATMAPRASSSLILWPFSYGVNVIVIFGMLRTQLQLRVQGPRRVKPPE